ncbi:bifunctional glutamate N-acetyltransferase/amino-acid acetyltransferase ArgJ [Candidatus Woesearchaeota archaeon]|nr:bifunctional glutamate N-acetyltransferase/amino-acid acetyltransferase ArgJ [Candidatus Woesearchaeota archaeon]
MSTGVNTVKGVTSLGKNVGIKKSKKDFAVICSSKLCNAAAVYTQNEVKGAPLYVNMEHLKNGKAQAIVVNSGISNVSTGKKGLKDAHEMASLAAKELGIRKEDVLVASTGLIGAYLPMDKIRRGAKGIKKQLSKQSKAAEAIMTTDLAKKEISVKVGKATIGAIAKGAGMIHPNMATMLAFIATDAEFPSSKLRKMLKQSVNKSFNMLSVDQDTSTSDMAILMANGLAGKVNEKQFQKALDYVCVYLAKLMAKDGEGASKLIISNVKNAKTEKDAKKVAKSIINSNLVKCAVFGNDPNWGRIMGAVGCAGVKINADGIDIYFGKMKIVAGGIATKFDKKKATKILKKKEVEFTVNLNQGKHSATAYGCDLTYKYVKINAAYHT